MFFRSLPVISLATNVSVVLLLCSCSFASAQQQIPTKQEPNSAKSHPIGRLLSAGDRNKKKGSFIFPGDRINPIEGQKVKVLCYLNRKILELGKGAVDDTEDKCVRDSTEVRKCTLNSRSNCPKPKTPNTTTEIPVLVNPYSNVLLNPRPFISWYGIPSATSYIVTLSGKGSNWKKQTNTTTLPYPVDERPMQSGNTYRLNVIANKGSSPFRSSSTVLIVLPNSEVQKTKNIIKHIQNLKLTPDEEARDIETVFRSKNLLGEAIEVLKERIDAGTNNATLHRLLGDRYLEVGLPEKAKSLYIKATALARESNNTIELKLAKSGLQDVINSLQQDYKNY